MIAILAGFFATFSITSIALSSILLSNTLFTFLFSASLVVFVRALDQRRIAQFLFAGVLTSLAILVRPIGKHWPIMMVFVALLYAWSARTSIVENFRRALPGFGKTMLAGLLAASLLLPWVLRNGFVHGLPVLAITTISARANVASKALGNVQGKDHREIQSEWDKSTIAELNGNPVTIAALCRGTERRMKEVERDYPFEVLKAYAVWSWENINEQDYLLPMLIPPLERANQLVNGFLKRTGLIQLRYYVACLGLIFLLIGKQYRAFVVLGAVFLYYSATVGAYPYQGSRYFLPGMIAGWILAAVAVFSLVVRVSDLFQRATRKRSI